MLVYLLDWMHATRIVKRAKRKRNRDVAFHISFVSRKIIAFHVSFERNVAKYFIFVKITLERKKFRLYSTFRCSNVTKNHCISRFIRAKRDVETLKLWHPYMRPLDCEFAMMLFQQSTVMKITRKRNWQMAIEQLKYLRHDMLIKVDHVITRFPNILCIMC
jgi:hypothetical protein